MGISKLSIKGSSSIFSFNTSFVCSFSLQHSTLSCLRLVIFYAITFILSLTSFLVSLFPSPSPLIASVHSSFCLSHTHLSLRAKCLFICLSWVCLFGDRSEYILVKRQDKYQTVLKWSWQGKECHSYFTVYCAAVLLMLWFLQPLCSTVHDAFYIHTSL